MKTLKTYSTLKFIVLFHYIPSEYMNLGKPQTEGLYLIFLAPNPGFSSLHHTCWSPHNEMDRLWMGGRKNLKEISETSLPNKWNWTTEQQVTQPWELREKEMIHLILKNHYMYLKPSRAMQHINIFHLKRAKWKVLYSHLGWSEHPLNGSLYCNHAGKYFPIKQLLSLPKWHRLVHHHHYNLNKNNGNSTLNICIDFLLLKEFNIYHLV